MERNHNPNVVVMAKEFYEQLIGMSRAGVRYEPLWIDRHVRKFNPHRQAAWQERVRRGEAKRSEQIRSARKFKEQHVGKVVYARVDMLGNTKGDDLVLMPVKVMRISKDRRCVDVAEMHHIDWATKHRCYTKVTADNLQLEVPEGYIPGVGSYHRYLVKENGPYDIREALAESDRRHEAYMAQQAAERAFKQPTAVAYDVIGER